MDLVSIWGFQPRSDALKRGVFNFAAAVSMALLAVTLALWARSYWHYDFAEYSELGRLSVAAHSGVGVILLELQRTQVESSWIERWLGDAEEENGWSFGTTRVQTLRRPFWIDDSTFWGQLGLQLWHESRGAQYAWLRLSSPHWLVCLLAAVLPVVRFRRVIRSARRSSQGLCPACGYDIRATPERCPECGSPVSAGASVPAAPAVRVRLIWWSAAALILVVLGAQALENHLAIDRFAEWRAQVQRARDEELRTHRKVSAYFSQRMKKRMATRADAEALAAQGKWASAMPARSDPLYEDPDNGALVRLHMLGNVWAAHEVLPRSIPQPAMPIAASLWVLVTIAYAAAWVCLWIFPVQSVSRRQFTIHLLLALTTIAAVCAAASWLMEFHASADLV